MSTAVLTGVAWAYRNGGRHSGHKSGSGVASGVFARYHRMAGNRVLMVSGPASPENATQAPKIGWPYVDPNPPGMLRQSPQDRLPPACATDPAARRKGPRPR